MQDHEASGEHDLAMLGLGVIFFFCVWVCQRVLFSFVVKICSDCGAVSLPGRVVDTHVLSCEKCMLFVVVLQM